MGDKHSKMIIWMKLLMNSGLMVICPTWIWLVAC